LHNQLYKTFGIDRQN
jgi:hypothetical protein